MAPPPLPMHELDADTLTDALRACLGTPAYRERATGLAHAIRAEDGAGVVVSRLAQFEGGEGQRV